MIAVEMTDADESDYDVRHLLALNTPRRLAFMLANPMCCAITEAGMHCRNKPQRRLGESLGLPWFIKVCSVHGGKIADIRHAEEHEQALVQLREKQRRMREADVYYIRRASDGRIKIGYSSQLQKRLYQLGKEHGEIELLATHKGGRDAESAQHDRFHEHHYEGEWFNPAPELLEHVRQISARRTTGTPDSAVIRPLRGA